MRVATPYGAFELKRVYQKNLGMAVLLAGLVHILLIGSFLVFSHITSQKPTATRVITIKSIAELGAPPSLSQAQARQVAVAAPAAAAAPSVGIPEAVPDDEAKETVTLASQTELGALQNPTIATEGTGREDIVIDIPEEEYLPTADEFIPYEEAPVPIKWIKPKYPELAEKAGVEGMVWVQALVDKHGKVRDAKCIKTGSVNPDIFCDAAVEAAKQNEYKPAISNKEPVAVWVQYKVEFLLK
ncbi:MAG: energy transducer TonB [candidate division Zixibacteria bacterium]|nr:energy transducer TonB [candidate division Zixibacteria bacterium]